MKRIGIYIVIVVCILSCISSRRNLLTETRLMLVDTRATEHTAALFYNLRQLTGKRVVYGQHNYEMDGFDSDSTRWRDEANRCDAYDVTGLILLWLVLISFILRILVVGKQKN